MGNDMKPISPPDWRPIRNALDEAYKTLGLSMLTEPGNSYYPTEHWNIAVLVYQSAIKDAAKFTACRSCGVQLDFHSAVRCLDCGMIMCESCARQHFGSGHGDRAAASHGKISDDILRDLARERGCVLVPREPTEAVRRAIGGAPIAGYGVNPDDLYDRIYRAMLAAAETPLPRQAKGKMLMRKHTTRKHWPLVNPMAVVVRKVMHITDAEEIKQRNAEMYARLRAGKMTDPKDIERMIKAICIAENLRRDNLANDHGPTFERAVQALCSIRQRRADKQLRAFIASGEELAAIDDALFVHGVQLDHCSVAEIDEAQRRLKVSVESALRALKEPA